MLFVRKILGELNRCYLKFQPAMYLRLFFIGSLTNCCFVLYVSMCVCVCVCVCV